MSEATTIEELKLYYYNAQKIVSTCKVNSSICMLQILVENPWVLSSLALHGIRHSSRLVGMEAIHNWQPKISLVFIFATCVKVSSQLISYIEWTILHQDEICIFLGGSYSSSQVSFLDFTHVPSLSFLDLLELHVS